MAHPVVHFEIAGPDLEKTRAFYGELFGWRADEQMPGYALVETGTDAGIKGGLMRAPEGAPPYVTIYVEVEDLEAFLDRAELLGAKTIVERMPIPGFGAFAMFADPDGNMIGLFETRTEK